MTTVGNKCYGNGKVLELALLQGKCLFSVSGNNSYPMSKFYK